MMFCLGIIEKKMNNGQSYASPVSIALKLRYDYGIPCAAETVRLTVSSAGPIVQSLPAVCSVTVHSHAHPPPPLHAERPGSGAAHRGRRDVRVLMTSLEADRRGSGAAHRGRRAVRVLMTSLEADRCGSGAARRGRRAVRVLMTSLAALYGCLPSHLRGSLVRHGTEWHCRSGWLGWLGTMVLWRTLVFILVGYAVGVFILDYLNTYNCTDALKRVFTADKGFAVVVN